MTYRAPWRSNLAWIYTLQAQAHGLFTVHITIRGAFAQGNKEDVRVFWLQTRYYFDGPNINRLALKCGENSTNAAFFPNELLTLQMPTS